MPKATYTPGPGESPYYDAGADWSLIPEHMRGAVSRYVMHGLHPGGFLPAIICNDLQSAVARADSVNQSRIADYIRFFSSHVPRAAWGAESMMNKWMKGRGLVGLLARPPDAIPHGEVPITGPGIGATGYGE